VTKGPEYHNLSKEQKELIFSKIIEIDSMNNRMGYQLKSQVLPTNKSEIITSSIIPGTVQLTPSGELIILMRDCQTTGGYSRILQLTDMAINQMAQKKSGDKFKFVLESSYTFLNRLVSKLRD
jgi:allophanate hydrolase subunit 2